MSIDGGRLGSKEEIRIKELDGFVFQPDFDQVLKAITGEFSFRLDWPTVSKIILFKIKLIVQEYLKIPQNQKQQLQSQNSNHPTPTAKQSQDPIADITASLPPFSFDTLEQVQEQVDFIVKSLERFSSDCPFTIQRLVELVLLEREPQDQQNNTSSPSKRSPVSPLSSPSLNHSNAHTNNHSSSNIDNNNNHQRNSSINENNKNDSNNSYDTTMNDSSNTSNLENNKDSSYKIHSHYSTLPKYLRALQKVLSVTSSLNDYQSLSKIDENVGINQISNNGVDGDLEENRRVRSRTGSINVTITTPVLSPIPWLANQENSLSPDLALQSNSTNQRSRQSSPLVDRDLTTPLVSTAALHENLQIADDPPLSRVSPPGRVDELDLGVDHMIDHPIAIGRQPLSSPTSISHSTNSTKDIVSDVSGHDDTKAG
ncbi:expressed protein [Phakopsora pachyrhizi]|uniref:Expressed protein n=1 Tax=Phakopsora pachyrhizi TaxID=170000 RepID=A0AAV0AIE6_PHAPC|nr:expressed protein [Phakopsora pachyrhizi]